jgi:hypothetical protein
MVVLGVIGAVVLAILVSLVLGTQQRTAYESFATEGVRVGDPGHNLVGPDWSGDARVRYVRLYRRRKPIAFPASPRACQNRGRAPSQN